MNKSIFIINGSGGVGKDKFVELFSQYVPTINFSSIDKVKEIAKLIGWDGVSKTDKDRKFLSDLKRLTEDYCGMPFQSLVQKVEEFKNDTEHNVLFLHIREPEEIARAVEAFNANTILVTRPSVEQICSNTSDANVMNYKYDIKINNKGTLEDLDKLAKDFSTIYMLYNR